MAPARALALLALAALGLGGCASIPDPEIATAADRGDQCRALFDQADATVAAAGTEDARAARIAGFPWLRVTRPLASYRDQVATEPRFRAWLQRLASQDAAARKHEIANLSAAERRPLAAAWRAVAASNGLPSELDAAFADCRTQLNAELVADAEARERLRERAFVADSYDTAKRVLGLYPLARLVARPQIKGLHEQLTEQMAAGPTTESVHSYRVPPATTGERDPAAIVAGMSRDALGIPQPTAGERAALLDAHAPVWRVADGGPADQPGALVLNTAGKPVTDRERPVEYRHFAWTRFRGEVLPQLVYTLWFPERPAEGWFDIYAGPLDAVTWRVTLTPEGEVLAADSIHACGCYYTLFPGAGQRARSDWPRAREPVFAPAMVPATGPGERVRLTLASGTHYILDVAAAKGIDAQPLAPLKTDALRSLPLPQGGHASAYASDGLIPRSARPERFLLWPLGVPSAGAMRQRGTHAIAFVGRRHFDDPYLLERVLQDPG